MCRTRIIRYAPPSACEVYDANVTGQTTYTANNLLPNTDYWAAVAVIGFADICQDEYYWSDPVYFKTASNRPPTCTINGPTSITYDAKRYWDANKTLRTQNPTEHRLNLSLSDPDGDAVSVTNVTVDRNCLTSRRAGNDVYVTPQGQVTGVTPALTGTNTCDVQVDSGQ